MFEFRREKVLSPQEVEQEIAQLVEPLIPGRDQAVVSLCPVNKGTSDVKKRVVVLLTPLDPSWAREGEESVEEPLYEPFFLPHDALQDPTNVDNLNFRLRSNSRLHAFFLWLFLEHELFSDRDIARVILNHMRSSALGYIDLKEVRLAAQGFVFHHLYGFKDRVLQHFDESSLPDSEIRQTFTLGRALRNTTRGKIGRVVLDGVQSLNGNCSSDSFSYRGEALLPRSYGDPRRIS